MKLYEIYFSPTGGTRKVSGMIADAFSGEKMELDLLEPGIREKEFFFSGEDICIVAVPSFGGRVPEIVLEKLKRFHGNGAKAILTAVYGNRDFEDTLAELKEALDRAGFFSVAAVAAIAEHSIIHKFAAGRPDHGDEAELKGYGAKIKAHLEAGMEPKEVKVPGKRPYREYNGVPMKPAADKGCIKCGKCALYCPVQAIPTSNPASVNKDTCISCMHCITVCPEHARHNNKLLLFAAEKKMSKSCTERKENKLYLP